MGRFFFILGIGLYPCQFFYNWILIVFNPNIYSRLTFSQKTYVFLTRYVKRVYLFFLSFFTGFSPCKLIVCLSFVFFFLLLVLLLYFLAFKSGLDSADFIQVLDPPLPPGEPLDRGFAVPDTCQSTPGTAASEGR